MKIIRGLLVGITTVLVHHSVHALSPPTLSWNNTNTSGGAAWSTAANWSPAQAPNDGYILLFKATASLNRSMIQDEDDVQINTMDFQGIGYSLSGTQISKRISAQTWTMEQPSNGGVTVNCSFGTIAGNTTINVLNPSAFLTLGGGVEIGDHTITIKGAGDVTMSALTTAGTIVKMNSGLLSLVGANTMSPSKNSIAAIDVQQGTLSVQQSSAVGDYTTTIESGATMIGTGYTETTINRGTIAPGSPTSVGTLKFNGILTCPADSSSNVKFKLAGPRDDQRDTLTLAGSADFGGATLTVALLSGFTPSIGDSFTIVSGAIPGSPAMPFRNLPEGTKFASGRYIFSITYRGGSNSDSVIIQRVAIPAPVVTLTSTSGQSNFSFKLTGFASEVVKLESSSDLSIWSQVGSDITLDMNGSAVFSTPAIGKMFFRATPIEP